MKYVNPLSFLTDRSYSANEPPDKKDLLLQKKKLLAEIELSERQTVLVKEAELNKDDILKLFEGLQNGDDVFYHAAIAADAVLYDFLTTGNLTGNGRFANNLLYSETGFLRFIAPYYKDVFTTAVLKALRNDEIEMLTKLWHNPVLLDGNYREQSFSQIRRHLLEQKNQLLLAKDKAVEKGKARLDEFLLFFDVNLLAALNILPEEFRQFKDDYGLELINTGIAIQHINLKLAVSILENVRLLNCSDYIQEQNEDRYEILYNNLHPQKSPFKFGSWQLFAIIILFIRITVAFSHCDTQQDYNATIYNEFNEKSNIYATINEQHFSLTKRYKATNSFINQIAAYCSDTTHNTPVQIKTGVVLQSGSNPYKQIFGEAGINGPEYDSLLGDDEENMTGSSLTTTSANSDISNKVSTKSDYYKEQVQFENTTEQDVIAIVETEDSTFSCFINKKDTASINIRHGLNLVYFFIGNNWDPSKQLKALNSYREGNKKRMNVTGAFRVVSTASLEYLEQPFLLTVDNEAISTQDRRSWFTIENIQSAPHIVFETLSSKRIKMARKSL